MKKLIVCCLIVLLGSCKGKEKDVVVPDPDYAPKYVGTYVTNTVMDTYNTQQEWIVEAKGKNLLGISYKVVTGVTVPIEINSISTYTLKNVKITDSLTFVVNEEADLVKDNLPMKEKVEGTGVKVADGSGKLRVGITFKFTDANNKQRTTEYLVFKKQ